MKKWPIPADWQNEGDGVYIAFFCFPKSKEWVNLLRGHFEELPYGWNWDEKTGQVTTAQAIARDIVESWCYMDCGDFNNNLDRIATSLESLDAKAAAFYSYTDFIEDLEDALGVGSLVYQVVAGILGLMPRLQAKVDFTWAIKAVWEYMTWRAPILTAITAISAAQGVLAASAATGKVLGIIDTAMGAIGILQTTALGWKDIIFGDKSLWDDLVRPLWDFFTGDTEAADVDDELRLQQINDHLRNVYLTDIADSLRHQNQILTEQKDCLCQSGGACCTCGAGIIVPPTTIDITADVPEGFVDCTEYDAYKCKAANWLTDKLVEAATRIDQITDNLRNFIDDAAKNGTYSIGQLNVNVSTYLGTALNPIWRANLTQGDVSAANVALTQWMADFLDAIAVSGSEGDHATIEADYVHDVIADIITQLSIGKNAVIQDIFANGDDTDIVQSDVQTWVQDAITASGVTVEGVADFFNAIVSKGVANTAFVLVPTIDQYISAISCVGSSACDDTGYGPLRYNEQDSAGVGSLDVDSWDGTTRLFTQSAISHPEYLFVADFVGFTNGNPGTANVTVNADVYITHYSDNFNAHNLWKYIVRAKYQDDTILDFVLYEGADQNGADRYLTRNVVVTDQNPENPVVSLQLVVDYKKAAPLSPQPTSADHRYQNVSIV